MGVVNACACTGIAQQSVEFSRVTGMDEIENSYALQFGRTSSGEDLGRSGRKHDLTGRIKLEQKVCAAKRQRDKTIPLLAQVIETLLALG